MSSSSVGSGSTPDQTRYSQKQTDTSKQTDEEIQGLINTFKNQQPAIYERKKYLVVREGKLVCECLNFEELKKVWFGKGTAESPTLTTALKFLQNREGGATTPVADLYAKYLTKKIEPLLSKSVSKEDTEKFLNLLKLFPKELVSNNQGLAASVESDKGQNIANTLDKLITTAIQQGNDQLALMTLGNSPLSFIKKEHIGWVIALTRDPNKKLTKEQEATIIKILDQCIEKNEKQAVELFMEGSILLEGREPPKNFLMPSLLRAVKQNIITLDSFIKTYVKHVKKCKDVRLLPTQDEKEVGKKLLAAAIEQKNPQLTCMLCENFLLDKEFSSLIFEATKKGLISVELTSDQIFKRVSRLGPWSGTASDNDKSYFLGAIEAAKADTKRKGYFYFTKDGDSYLVRYGTPLFGKGSLDNQSKRIIEVAKFCKYWGLEDNFLNTHYTEHFTTRLNNLNNKKGALSSKEINEISELLKNCAPTLSTEHKTTLSEFLKGVKQNTEVALELFTSLPPDLQWENRKMFCGEILPKITTLTEEKKEVLINLLAQAIQNNDSEITKSLLQHLSEDKKVLKYRLLATEKNLIEVDSNTPEQKRIIALHYLKNIFLNLEESPAKAAAVLSNFPDGIQAQDLLVVINNEGETLLKSIINLTKNKKEGISEFIEPFFRKISAANGWNQSHTPDLLSLFEAAIDKGMYSLATTIRNLFNSEKEKFSLTEKQQHTFSDLEEQLVQGIENYKKRHDY